MKLTRGRTGQLTLWILGRPQNFCIFIFNTQQVIYIYLIEIKTIEIRISYLLLYCVSEYKVLIKYEKDDKYSICIGDSKTWFLATGEITSSTKGFFVRSEIDKTISSVKIFVQDENIHLFTNVSKYIILFISNYLILTEI